MKTFDQADRSAAADDCTARAAAGSATAPPADRDTRLRVGVMLDDWSDRAWIAKTLEDIQRSDVAQVVTVILNKSPGASRWKHLRERLPILLYLLYYRLDRWLFRRLLRVRNDAFDAVDLRPLLRDARVMEVTPECRQYTDRFDAATVERLRGENLDVILRFGFRIIRGPILQTARYGVWSFHHGDNREYRGGPPMFWEMYEGSPLCGVTLQVLTDQLDGGKVIYRSLGKTNSFSLYLTRNRNYWKGSESVVRRLRQLHASGSQALTDLDTYREQATYTKGIYRTPRNLTMLKFLAQLAGRAVRRFFEDLLTEEQWSIAWRKRPQPPVVGLAECGEPFRLLRPPRGYFYADPFQIESAGRHYLFFEDYEYASRKAVISWVELDAAGNPSSPRVAVSTDYHLSYPFLFEHDGRFYMIPETRERRRVELWRAEQFPDRWVFDRVLIDDISAVDATLLREAGRYWLLAGVAVDGGVASDELHVFSASSPFGPWQPHRKNPVVATIRGARPAGRVFQHEGHLIRPGQDGAKIYGYQVFLYRIDRLDEEEYRETQVGTIRPDWLPRNLGTHTYNCDDKYELIDGRVRVLRGLRLRRRKLPTT